MVYNDFPGKSRRPSKKFPLAMGLGWGTVVGKMVDLSYVSRIIHPKLGSGAKIVTKCFLLENKQSGKHVIRVRSLTCYKLSFVK